MLILLGSRGNGAQAELVAGCSILREAYHSRPQAFQKCDGLPIPSAHKLSNFAIFWILMLPGAQFIVALSLRL